MHWWDQPEMTGHDISLPAVRERGWNHQYQSRHDRFLSFHQSHVCFPERRSGHSWVCSSGRRSVSETLSHYSAYELTRLGKLRAASGLNLELIRFFSIFRHVIALSQVVFFFFSWASVFCILIPFKPYRQVWVCFATHLNRTDPIVSVSPTSAERFQTETETE